MATLYVENLPDDLYEALKSRARSQRKSLAQEVIAILEKHVPTAAELERHRRSLERILRMSSRKKPAVPGPFPSAEEMVREDRRR